MERGWSDPSLLVLSSLAGGEKHGYAMVADIEAMAGVQLGPGTLYGALSRLESQGLIEPVGSRWAAPALPDHRGRAPSSCASG